MVSLIDPAVPHVPAWKRLGLKLKYAKDTPEDVVRTADSVPNSKKRGLSHLGVIVETTPTKKTKKSGRTSTETPARKNATPTEPSARQQEQTIPQSPAASPTLTKRKSVAFTPETKTEDGDSVKQLYHTWLAEQKAEDLPSTPNQAGQALALASPSPLPRSKEPPVKKVKRSKKEKAKPPAPPEPKLPSRSHTSPSLEYLTLYHTSRTTWKFNKAKQTHLLKHLFSPSTLSPSHDAALASYLSGLQSASARTRIREAASTAIAADDAALSSEPSNDKEDARMEDPALRREYYQHALNRYKAQLKGLEIEREDREQDLDPAWRLRLLKRKRAEMVLWATGGDVDAGTAEAQAMEGDTGGTVNGGADGDARKRTKLNEWGPKRRRRKRRTTGVPDDDDDDDDDVSSSSSSSGESSGSEGDGGDEDRGGNGGAGSSGSSSSSSKSSEEDPSSGSDSGDGSSSSSSSESGSDSDSGSDSG